MGEHGVSADFLRCESETAGGVYGSAIDGAAGGFLYGGAFAGEHRFVNGGVAAQDFAIHRDALAGADDDLVADLQVVNGDFGFAAVSDGAGGFGLQSHKGGDCAGCAPLGASLKVFAQQHKGDDGG